MNILLIITTTALLQSNNPIVIDRIEFATMHACQRAAYEMRVDLVDDSLRHKCIDRRTGQVVRVGK